MSFVRMSSFQSTIMNRVAKILVFRPTFGARLFHSSSPLAVIPPLDPYKTLGVKHDANQEVIKEAFLRLSKQYHPDSSDSANTAKFVSITEAYSLIGKEEKRKEFDLKHRLEPFSHPNSFEVHYQVPPSNTPTNIKEAFDEEMHRRWETALKDWVNFQASYEMDRGFMPKVVNDNYPWLSYTSKEDHWFVVIQRFFLLFTFCCCFYVYNLSNGLTKPVDWFKSMS